MAPQYTIVSICSPDGSTGDPKLTALVTIMVLHAQNIILFNSCRMD